MKTEDLFVTLNDTGEDMIVLKRLESIYDETVYKPIHKIVMEVNKDEPYLPIGHATLPILPLYGKKCKGRYYIFYTDHCDILEETDVPFDDAIGDFIDNFGIAE